MPMIGGTDMAERITFTLTDIPGELGQKIISQIRASKKPSRDEMEEKVQEMKLRILAKELHEQQ